MHHRLAAPVLAAGAAALVALAGCASPQRPVLEHSAAEVAPEELDFYDTLAAQDVATRDDALHAILLLGAGRSGMTYTRRVQLADALGWISASEWIDRGTGLATTGREAVTLGEVSGALANLFYSVGVVPPALMRAEPEVWVRRARWAPASSSPDQGLSGAQLLALMADAEAELGSRAGTAAIPADDWENAAPSRTPGDPIRPEPIPAHMEDSGETESFSDFLPLAPGDGAAPSPAAPPPSRAPVTSPSRLEEATDKPVPRVRPEPLPDLPPASDDRNR